MFVANAATVGITAQRTPLTTMPMRWTRAVALTTQRRTPLRPRGGDTAVAIHGTAGVGGSERAPRRGAGVADLATDLATAPVATGEACMKTLASVAAAAMAVAAGTPAAITGGVSEP